MTNHYRKLNVITNLITGPLELVKSNIMQLSEPLNNVIKNGQVNFKVNTKHASFNKYRDQRSPEGIFDTIQVSPENALSPAR